MLHKKENATKQCESQDEEIMLQPALLAQAVVVGDNLGSRRGRSDPWTRVTSHWRDSKGASFPNPSAYWGRRMTIVERIQTGAAMSRVLTQNYLALRPCLSWTLGDKFDTTLQGN